MFPKRSPAWTGRASVRISVGSTLQRRLWSREGARKEEVQLKRTLVLKSTSQCIPVTSFLTIAVSPNSSTIFPNRIPRAYLSSHQHRVSTFVVGGRKERRDEHIRHPNVVLAIRRSGSVDEPRMRLAVHQRRGRVTEDCVKIVPEYSLREERERRGGRERTLRFRTELAAEVKTLVRGREVPAV